MIPHVKNGDRLRTQPMNRVVDAANMFLQGRGADYPKVAQSGSLIFVLNKTGRDMLLGEVAPYHATEAMPYPDAPERMFQGTVVALREPSKLEDWSNWAVMAQTIPNGLSGWAYDSGNVMARVRILKTEGEADPHEADYVFCDMVLDADSSGSAEDWWHLTRLPVGPGRMDWVGPVVEVEDPEADDNFHWALVRFGGHDQYPMLYKVMTTPEAGAKTIEAKPIDKDGEEAGIEATFTLLP
jgi:hypothetical protein